MLAYNLGSGYDEFCFWNFELCPNGQYIREVCHGDPHCFLPLLNFTTLSYEEYRRFFVSFSVYYPSLSYIKIETSPATTFAGLLANIGGSMGLIVSVSVFTIFEIAELFCLILYTVFFKQIKKINNVDL